MIEYGLSLVPAIASKLTVNYRLRGLLAQWMEWDDVRSRAESLFGSETPMSHLLALGILTAIMLGVALFWLSRAEYPTQLES